MDEGVLSRDAVSRAIERASQVNECPDSPAADGYSGGKLLALLQELSRAALVDDDRCYLEIGVFRGLTLTSVAGSVPDRRVYGIDTFESFNPDQDNEARVRDRLHSLNLANADLIVGDYEAALADLDRYIGNRRIGVLFVDGPHDYRSQYLGMALALRWLASDALIVVDDANYEHVRLSCADFLSANPAFELVFQAYTPGHPHALAAGDFEDVRRGWWNGVIVLGTRGLGDAAAEIPTGNGRRSAVALHDLQGHYLFDYLPELLRRCRKISTDETQEALLGFGHWLKTRTPMPTKIRTYSPMEGPRNRGDVAARRSSAGSAPRISVITASSNALPGLKLTVDSVRVQTFRDYEHIIVDGASTDGTPDWLAAQGDALRWVSEPDDGIADALNKGLAMARGEYVLVLQAEDTLLSPESIAEAVTELDGSDIVSFDVIFVTPRGDRQLRSRGFSSKLAFKTTIPHQGALCRRALFDRIGAFDPSFRIALDYEFFLRAHRAGATLKLVARPLARMPDTGVSSRLGWRSLKSRFDEERRVQQRHAPGLAMSAVYALYWPSYLTYRKLRSAVRAVRIAIRQRRQPRDRQGGGSPAMRP